MKQSENFSTPLIIFTGLFMGCVIMAGVHGVKLAQIGPFMFDGGLLIYASTFIITDIVVEIYGKQHAIRIAKMGFFALLGAFIATKAALLLPASPEWETQAEYTAVLGLSSRIILAALLTFVASQAIDIALFSWVRKKTGAKHLWLRNNVSTICGGTMDALIFSTIAFYDVYPLLPIMTSAILVRTIFALIDTPIVYLAVWFIGNKRES